MHLQNRVVAGSFALLRLDELKEGAPSRELLGGAEDDPGRGLLAPVGYPEVLAQNNDLRGHIQLEGGRARETPGGI